MFLIYTDPGKTNISLKRARENICKLCVTRKAIIFQSSIFRGELAVSFRQCIWIVSIRIICLYIFIIYCSHIYIIILYTYIYIYIYIEIYLLTSYIANRSKNKINVWRDSSYLPGARSIAVYGTRQMGNSDRLKIWGLFFGRQSV